MYIGVKEGKEDLDRKKRVVKNSRIYSSIDVHWRIKKLALLLVFFLFLQQTLHLFFKFE